MFVHTPGMVTHGVGHPDWSHRSYAIVVDDEALDLFLFAADDARAASSTSTRSSPAARRRCRAGASGCGCRARITRRRRRRSPSRRSCASGAFPATCSRSTAAPRGTSRRASTSSGIPSAFPIRAPRSPRSTRTHLRVCVWEYPYVSVHSRAVPASSRSAAILLKNGDGDPYVFGWDTAPGTSPFGDVLTPLPESGIVDFTNPEAYAWWRDAHQRAVRRRRRRDQERLRRAGARRRGRATTAIGDAGCTTSIRCCTTSASTRRRASSSATEDGPPMVWSRAGWTGSQRYPIGWGGDPQSDWEGLAASIRGGLSWGMSGNPYHSSRHRRLLRRRAAVGRAVRALAAGDACSARTCACTASASASPGRSAPRPRRSAASGSRSAIG